MAIVKANAYGHGLELVTKAVGDHVDWFGVDNFEEALLLRRNSIKKPTLILGYVPADKLGKAIKLNISLAVYRNDILKKAAREARKVGRKAKIHLKIETGTNRQGVAVSDLPLFITEFQKYKELLLEGVYTHFANIEDTTDPSFAMEQLEEFKIALRVLKKSSLVPKIVHSGATAATLLYPQTHFNMVRVGIGLYGLWPSEEIRRVSRKITLVPALSWKTQAVQVKDVPKGESVGYGRIWISQRPSKIAVVPVGYSDGYGRALSNQGKVLIRGKFAPVAGRVAMNIMVVDVTDIPEVEVGDEVVLIGRQGKNEITVDDLAKLLDTINYEVVARLNPNIPRRLVN